MMCSVHLFESVWGVLIEKGGKPTLLFVEMHTTYGR